MSLCSAPIHNLFTPSILSLPIHPLYPIPLFLPSPHPSPSLSLSPIHPFKIPSYPHFLSHHSPLSRSQPLSPIDPPSSRPPLSSLHPSILTLSSPIHSPPPHPSSLSSHPSPSLRRNHPPSLAPQSPSPQHLSSSPFIHPLSLPQSFFLLSLSTFITHPSIPRTIFFPLSSSPPLILSLIHTHPHPIHAALLPSIPVPDQIPLSPSSLSHCNPSSTAPPAASILPLSLPIHPFIPSYPPFSLSILSLSRSNPLPPIDPLIALPTIFLLPHPPPFPPPHSFLPSPHPSSLSSPIHPPSLHNHPPPSLP
ncbi:hypothetical protein FKM82_007289 [Ascaphus truei]